MKIFAVRMERWGDPEGHCYTLGLFSCPHLAMVEGKAEKISRGGKYYPSLVELETSDSAKEVEVLETYLKRGELGNYTKHLKLSVYTGSHLQVNQKLKTFPVLDKISLSDADMIELHDHIQSFSPDEQVIFRDWYFFYLRKKRLI